MNISSSLEIQKEDGLVILRFSGFIDAATAENARKTAATKISADCTNIIIDLTRVDFLDSHGVGFFVSLLKRAHASKGRLFFVGAGGQPAAVLNMVGFNEILVHYCTTMEQAEALLGNKDRKKR